MGKNIQPLGRSEQDEHYHICAGYARYGDKKQISYLMYCDGLDERETAGPGEQRDCDLPADLSNHLACHQVS